MNSHKEAPLKVAINAYIIPGKGTGGCESVLIGLVSALGRLEGNEEYTIVSPWQDPYWLTPYIGPNQKIIVRPRYGFSHSTKNLLWKRIAHSVNRRIKNRFTTDSTKFCQPEVPISDGFWESLDCEVVHFPTQAFEVCSRPFVFNPHDLQHKHLSQFFAPSEIVNREILYKAGCQYANTVVVASDWTKLDLHRQYNLSTDKIQVVPWAAPTQMYEALNDDDIKSLKSRYELNAPFAFFPASVWPHKNHQLLLEAIARLRDSGKQKIQLVCTGNDCEFQRKIYQLIVSLNLNEQVKFLGVVSTKELRGLYRLCQFVIVPTLFEAASGPLYEAWQENVPIACSTVTSLPEQAQDAALLFDPYSIDAIVSALEVMSSDVAYREELCRRGRKRLEDFSWERTAKAYRAVYRRAAGRKLSEEDKFILNWDWMKNPPSGIARNAV